MVAPIDATAQLVAGDETFTLAMNYRTIALAEEAQPDVVTAFGSGKPKLSGLAALVWAFAQPAHPTLTLDQALALVFQHGEAAGTAVAACFRLATKGAAAPDDAAARPRAKRGTTSG